MVKTWSPGPPWGQNDLLGGSERHVRTRAPACAAVAKATAKGNSSNPQRVREVHSCYGETSSTARPADRSSG